MRIMCPVYKYKGIGMPTAGILKMLNLASVSVTRQGSVYLTPGGATGGGCGMWAQTASYINVSTPACLCLS